MDAAWPPAGAGISRFSFNASFQTKGGVKFCLLPVGRAGRQKPSIEASNKIRLAGNIFACFQNYEH
jgi:hypothetical protein